MPQKNRKRIHFCELEPETKDKLNSLFVGNNGFLYCGDVKAVVPSVFSDALNDVDDMELYTDDVWVTSFPRSGTTWTQEITWLINNNMDFEKAKNTYLSERYAFLDLSIKMSEEELKYAPIELQEKAKVFRPISTYARPRHIKTHLHMSLLPPILETSKVIYVARNPLDSAVSNYHHSQLFKVLDYKGDFKTYWEFFTQGLLTFSPYFPHVKEAWALRDHPNMLFMFYEDMKKDINSCVRKIAKFLGKEYTDEQFQKLCDHVQFDKMKENKSLSGDKCVSSEHVVNVDAPPFFRKGKVGGWRDYFDEELTQQAEKWIRDNLADTDLTFPPY